MISYIHFSFSQFLSLVHSATLWIWIILWKSFSDTESTKGENISYHFISDHHAISIEDSRMTYDWRKQHIKIHNTISICLQYTKLYFILSTQFQPPILAGKKCSHSCALISCSNRCLTKGDSRYVLLKTLFNYCFIHFSLDDSRYLPCKQSF